MSCSRYFLAVTLPLLLLYATPTNAFIPVAYRFNRFSTPLYSITEHSTPEDAVVLIKPNAMERLRELKAKQKDPNSDLVLRMGVRKGGCSGMSYAMDFSTEEEIQPEDAVDQYEDPGLKCVVDAKSMLYLYGLELDYSDDLVGGGFKFFNPNADAACGCGSSFGVKGVELEKGSCTTEG